MPFFATTIHMYNEIEAAPVQIVGGKSQRYDKIVQEYSYKNEKVVQFWDCAQCGICSVFRLIYSLHCVECGMDAYRVMISVMCTLQVIAQCLNAGE